MHMYIYICECNVCFVVTTFRPTSWTRLCQCVGSRVPSVNALFATNYTLATLSSKIGGCIGIAAQIWHANASCKSLCSPSGILRSFERVMMVSVFSCMTAISFLISIRRSSLRPSAASRVVGVWARRPQPFYTSMHVFTPEIFRYCIKFPCVHLPKFDS